jgi:hypothetical protein
MELAVLFVFVLPILCDLTMKIFWLSGTYDFNNVHNFLLYKIRCSVMNLVLGPNPGNEPGSSLKNYA